MDFTCRLTSAWGLRRHDASTSASYRAHQVLFGLQVFLLLAGLALTRFSSISLTVLGLLALYAAAGVWLSERVSTILFEVPFSSSFIKKSSVVRYPSVFALFAAVIHIIPPMSPEAARLFGEGYPMSIPAGLFLGLAGVSFWLIVIHPRRYWKGARNIR